MACCKSLLARRIVLWYILLGSIVILPLTINVSMGCRFMTLEYDEEVNETFGPFNIAIYDNDTENFLGCVNYSRSWAEDTNEHRFLIARIASGLLLACTVVATAICTLLQCFSKSGKTVLWNVMRVFYVLALVAQGGMYTMFATDLCQTASEAEGKCTVGYTAIAGVFNFVFLLGMVVSTFLSFPPRNPVFQCWGTSDYDSGDEGSTEEEDEVMKKFKSFGEQQSGSNLDSISEVDDNESVSLFGGSSRVSRKSRKSVKMNDDAISAAESGRSKIGVAKSSSMSVGSKNVKSSSASVASNKSYSSKASRMSQKSTLTATKIVEEEISVAGDGSVISHKSSFKSTSASAGAPDNASVSSGKSVQSASKFLPYVAKYLAKDHKSASNDAGSVTSIRSKKSTEATIPENEQILSKNSSMLSTKSEERTSFINQLFEMTELAEGGRRVKADHKEYRIEIVDEYPQDSAKQIESSPSSDIVKIRTEYYDMGSRTIKEITHRDGSQTIVTTIVADDPNKPDEPNQPMDPPIESARSSGSIVSTNSSKYRSVVDPAPSDDTPTISGNTREDALEQGQLCLSMNSPRDGGVSSF